MISLGKCYYCGEYVIHEKPNDYGAFTKRYSKKEGRYICSDYWHMKCYYNKMNDLMKRGGKNVD